MSAFEVLPYSIEDIGARGSGSIRIHPRGFWLETVTLYVSRDWSRELKVEWRIDLSHSSGGHADVDGVSGIDAEENMALAMLEGVKIARDLIGRTAELETAYAAAHQP